jgi:membrane protease YdiL (CAAX protease family)
MSEARPRRETFKLLGIEFDIRATLIVITSTLLLMVDHYHRFIPSESFNQSLTSKAIERTVLYLIIPLLIIVLIFRDKPSEYGFGVGNWREGLLWTGGVIVVMAPILYLSARTPAMVDYYARSERSITHVISVSALDIFGWEFLFRGFILFGLARVAGPNAVLLQAVPFALAHVGKPELETMSTIFGGAGFGFVAWRTRSFVYPWLIHCFVSIFVILVAMAAAS